MKKIFLVCIAVFLFQNTSYTQSTIKLENYFGDLRARHIGPAVMSGRINDMENHPVMIKLGRIKGNKMVDMQLANNKLVKRGEEIVKSELNITESKAKELLKKDNNVRKAIDNYKESTIEEK